MNQMSKFVENFKKMFTTGQITFGIIFFIVFVVIMFFAYRQDKTLHQKFYKGNYKVLLFFLLFVALLFLMKFFLKR
jgi:uncharacterized membrane protein